MAPRRIKLQKIGPGTKGKEVQMLAPGSIETPTPPHHDITSNMGFTVYQPPTPTAAVTPSTWIKVEKKLHPSNMTIAKPAPSTAGGKGRGRVITLPSRRSPRKLGNRPAIDMLGGQVRGEGCGGNRPAIDMLGGQVRGEGCGGLQVYKSTKHTKNQEGQESTGVQALRSSPRKLGCIDGKVASNRSVAIGQSSTDVYPLRSSPRKHVQLQQQIDENPQGDNRVTPQTSSKTNNLADDGESHMDTVRPSSNAMNASVDVSPPKATRKRQRTMGKELNKYKRRNIKLSVEIPDSVMRPVGINAQMLITETGCVARGFAPLNVQSWKAIDKDERKKLAERVTNSFEVDGGEHNIAAIESEMARMYRAHKYRLHQHFLKFTSKEEALSNKPSDAVTDAQWEYLCDHFADPDFIKRSAINRHNRAARKTNHSSGTKSFARVSKELEVEQGEEVDRIQLWYETHYNKKNQEMG